LVTQDIDGFAQGEIQAGVRHGAAFLYCFWTDWL
jgi:hypothetical protein